MYSFPDKDPTPQTLMSLIRDLQREVSLLKEKPREEDIPTQKREQIVFSFHGPVTANLRSGPYRFKDFAATIHRLDIDVDTAGAGDSTYEVLVNGSVVHTGTLEAATNSLSETDLAIEVEEWDKVAVNWPTVGTGLATCVMALQATVVEGDDYA